MDMDIMKILLCLLLISSICTVLYLNIWMHGLMNFLRQKNDIELKRIELSSDITCDEVIDDLDNLIKGCFDEYYVLHLGYKKEFYINSDMEKEIIREVAELTVKRLSPLRQYKLELFYSKSEIPTIISSRVYMHVTNIVIDNNRAK